jgi:SnoaL-like domain
MTRIASPSIVRAKSPRLPSGIQTFIRAVNAFDPAAITACFTADALVNDQLRDFPGRAAIAAWTARELVAERVTLRVTQVTHFYTDWIVRAQVDGDYEKDGLPDPLVLTLHFLLHRGQIARLIILNLRAPDSPPQFRAPHAP